MTKTRLYLLVSGLVIIAIGLSYGAPRPALETSFGIAIDDAALHIFRAIMGLYCGLGILLLLGARFDIYVKPALVLEAVFFTSVGVGRVTSFLLDANIPSVAVGAVAVEIVLSVVTLAVLFMQPRRTHPGS
ncbi:DUF4345 family protein [Mangrovimicrobium sediminis]|uniref:DUF4345 family protein n=1 Tax=Mangrovimicrobium sediminis TaxID=2562682 RepID=UPI0014368E30|nr:DUF4345 family protein [Haliea sp. SAOS-164]